MPQYRATIRFTAAGQQYHVIDMTAPTLRDALREAADRFPDEALASADLLEIRIQADPEQREFAPEQ